MTSILIEPEISVYKTFQICFKEVRKEHNIPLYSSMSSTDIKKNKNRYDLVKDIEVPDYSSKLINVGEY